MTQLTEEKRWITVNGQHVQIDDDGTVVSNGPLKGTKLGKGVDKPATKDSGEKQDQPAKPAAKKPHVTDTPAFKKWFGDSKVVDKDGKPLVVYHGTKADFSIFDSSRGGESSVDSQKEFSKMGFWFSPKPEHAELFAKRSPGEGGDSVSPVYLKLENPFVWNWRTTTARDISPGDRKGSTARAIAKIKAGGYDGIVFKGIEDRGGTQEQIVAFSPTQIKSATGNKGTFDPTNPDIRESYQSQVDIEQLRTNAEAKLEKLLAKLDERHKKQLRAAIKQYGWNVPDEVWQAIQQDQENEELAAAILLLFTAADDWTTDAIKQQDVVARGYSRRQFMTYAFDAQKTVQQLAAQTTDTLRKRITRKVQDAQLTGPGDVGEITDEGIDATLDDVFTPERRKGIATDQTTGAFSKGQTAAAERISDGASTTAGQSVTIRMLWVSERDNLVCPRCRPLDGQPEEVWGLVFPNGPGPEAHPNCRCALIPQVVVSTTTEESFREEKRWITVNGNHVQIDDEGMVISDGPLKGTKLGNGKSSGDNAGMDDKAKRLALAATKKGWSKKVLRDKAEQAGVDFALVQRHRSEIELERNPGSYHPPHTDEERAAAKVLRDKQQSDAVAKAKATRAEQDKHIDRLKQLPHGERIQAQDYLRQTESPREARQYADAAVSFNTADPQRAATDLAIKAIADRGIKLRQRGANYSWYGKTADGRSIRVADHLGTHSHDIEITFDRPYTKSQAEASIADAIDEAGLTKAGESQGS